MRYYMNLYLIGKVLRPDPISACQKHGSTFDIQQALRNKEQYMIYKTIISSKITFGQGCNSFDLKNSYISLEQIQWQCPFPSLKKAFFHFPLVDFVFWGNTAPQVLLPSLNDPEKSKITERNLLFTVK